MELLNNIDAQKRLKALRLISEYCVANTSVDPWDAVAFFSNQYNLTAEGAIAYLKKADPEEFEGAYNTAIQAGWDDRGASSHYYCSQILG